MKKPNINKLIKEGRSQKYITSYLRGWATVDKKIQEYKDATKRANKRRTDSSIKATTSS